MTADEGTKDGYGWLLYDSPPMPGPRSYLRTADERLGSTVLTVVALAVVVLVVAVGLGVAGVPEITATDSRVAGGDESTTVVESNVTVTNPNPVTVPPWNATVVYTVAVSGDRLGRGTVEDVRFPPGNTTVTVRTPVANSDLSSTLVEHVRNGERTNYTLVKEARDQRTNRTLYRTVDERSFETDVPGALTTNGSRPVDTNVPGLQGTVLYVNGTRAAWESRTDDRTALRVNATVYNPTSTRLPVRGATFDVYANDVALATGSATDVEPIPPGATRNVSVLFVVDDDRLDDWWASHVQRDQTSTVRVVPHVRIARGPLTVTVSPGPVTRTVHTQVFGDPGERVRVDGNASTGS